MRLFNDPAEGFKTGIIAGAALILLVRTLGGIPPTPQDQEFCKNSISTLGCTFLVKVLSAVASRTAWRLGAAGAFYGFYNLLGRIREENNVPQAAPVAVGVRRP